MKTGARRVAVLSPKQLLRQLFFWENQKGFLTVISVCVAAALLLAPYTYASAGGWEVVSAVVHMLAAWGAVITAQALAKLEVEKAIVVEIERTGTEYLRDVRSGQRPRVDLDELEQIVVPNNPTQPPPAMVRLFQHIIKEARDRRFESSVSVIQPFREELLEDLFQLQNLQKIALWLGILGTFVGLLLAISSADLNSPDFLAIVQKMFAGLIVSFSASLAGLQVAVFIGILQLLLRKAQERYSMVVETAVLTMLSLARNAINKDDFLAEFSQITATIEALTNKVHAQTAETSHELQATREEIAAQTAAITGGVNRLQEARGTFDGFLSSLGESQSTFIQDVRNVYDTISLKHLGETLQGAVGESARTMAETVNASSRQIASRLFDFNASVDTLSQALETQAHQSIDSAQKIADQFQISTDETAKTMKLVVTRMQEMLQREVSVRGELNELSRTVAMLSHSLNNLDRTLIPRQRGVREILTSLRW